MASQGEDVMIGYNAADVDFAKKLAGTLRDKGYSVWYPNYDDPFSIASTTQALLACKVYIPVMTEASVVDKSLQEQLSLAYVSNSAIFPIGTTRHRFIAPKLSGGAKLILAKINWAFVLKPEDYTKNISNLIKCMDQDLQNRRSRDSESTEPIFTHGMTFDQNHLASLDLGGQDGYEGSTVPGTGPLSKPREGGETFWQKHFRGQESVRWRDFREGFFKEYGPLIDEEFGEKAEERKKLMANLMFRDLFGGSLLITQSAFEGIASQGQEKVHRFYQHVQDYLMAYLSLREIISMDSSLRIQTIQNLGNFKFPSIVCGLADLLEDPDANIRAVAAIALAHAGKSQAGTVEHLVKLLEDEDRLVRESACLSLGFLQAANAVDHIVDRWRNDPISTVREAAELALSKMNVPAAQRCIKVTQILSSEMSSLKPQG